jgi:hypothetical protein
VSLYTPWCIYYKNALHIAAHTRRCSTYDEGLMTFPPLKSKFLRTFVHSPHPTVQVNGEKNECCKLQQHKYQRGNANSKFSRHSLWGFFCFGLFSFYFFSCCVKKGEKKEVERNEE